jgi:flagellin-like protein
MKSDRLMRKITKIRRSVRAISPVIAVLLMIAIAVVASLVAYAWVIGLIGNTTTTASNSMLIQSTGHTSDTNTVVVYVQNVGQGTLELRQAESVYFNGILMNIDSSSPALSDGLTTFSPGATASLTTNYPYTANEKLKIKVVATDGTFAEYTQTGTTGTTGGGGTFGSHTIAATAGSWTHITPAGAISVSHGGSQSFQISSDYSTGYHVSDVLIDGISVGSQLSYKFTNVDADHSINAMSAANTAGTQIILATAGPNGAITPSGQVTVTNGNSQAFQIRPDAGYHISSIVVDGTQIPNPQTTYTFTSVTTSHTIEATFTADAAPTHTITVNPTNNGQITPQTGTVTHGTDKTYTITANSGFSVSNVVVDGESLGSLISYTFVNVIMDHTIGATFTAVTGSNHVIHASAGPNGQITPEGDVIVANGASKQFNILAESHYHIVDVLADGTSRGAITSYTFSSVQGDHSISATFAINTFGITASAGANGQISPSGTVQVNYGDDQAFNIQPSAGFRVSGVVVDGVSVGSQTLYTFTNVLAAHTISASFTAVQQGTHIIQASAGAHGAINPSGSVAVNDGSSQSFTITPVAHYHVADVLVDGASVGARASYTFTNVIADHTIAVTFAVDTVVITATAGSNGHITPTGAVSVGYGSSQAFTITPNAGFVVAGITVDGVNSGYGNSYTFTNVIADHTIAVTFTQGSTIIQTGFDGSPWDALWQAGGNPPWYGAVGQGIGGTTAAKSDPVGSNSGPFTTDMIDTRSASTLRITFMYMVLNTNNANDLRTAYSYNSANPDLSPNSGNFHYQTGIGITPPQDSVWYPGSLTISRTSVAGAIQDANAFSQFFYFRFESSLSGSGGSAEQVWVDNVVITMSP